MTISLDTPEQIEAYRLLSIRSALGLEVRTGMKFSNRVNVFQQAKAVLDLYDRTYTKTKRGVYIALDGLLDDLGLPNNQRPI